jgi:carbonic anhydrase/acetyltransferase-like protein (isoleucine patch superfamily)
MTLIPFQGNFPKLHPTVYVDQTAVIIGDVEIGSGSSIWFMTLARGDVNHIRIGEFTNIQDQSTIHVTREHFPTRIGSFVSVGHKAVLHGCIVGDYCLIGVGAILLDGVEIGDNCIVGSGALLPPGTTIPSGNVAMGSPATVARAVTAKDIEMIRTISERYSELAESYKERNDNPNRF